MRFIILYKSKTSKGANYFKLLVEISNGIWEEAIYFGNTTPKRITSLRLQGDNFIAEIQRHTSRDKNTGRFKQSRRLCIA